MSSNLKDLYNKEFISRLSLALKKQYPKFQQKQFIKAIFCSEWKVKELKSRMRHISHTMGECLPDNYKKSIEILGKCVQEFNGLEGMVFPEFVDLFGQAKNDWKVSMKALELFTQFSSSEFAIRPFIISNPVQAMKQLEKWSKSKNEHVRRLASEGCRPRLPWAMGLPNFKEDPKSVLLVLENLKQDDSLYVRRSVANNLNDIAKDHSELVIKTMTRWSKLKHEETDWLIKHGLRTLLKQGHPKALKLIGINPNAKISGCTIKVCDKKVTIGGDLNFVVKFESDAMQDVRLEYVIGFMKNNGKNSNKVFKLREKKQFKGKAIIEKKYSFKLITTRRYYSGVHLLYLMINGKEFAKTKFTLVKERR